MNTTTAWTRKHLLDIESLSAAEIGIVHDTARAFKAVSERAIKKVPALRGKTVINLFIEPSTRTRISFELAAMRLTADVINFTAEASSLKKGETPEQALAVLEKNPKFALFMKEEVLKDLEYGGTPKSRALINLNVAYQELKGEPVTTNFGPPRAGGPGRGAAPPAAPTPGGPSPPAK